MHVRNTTPVAITLDWVNSSGGEVAYGTIEPGASREQSAFVTHRWLARERRGSSSRASSPPSRSRLSPSRVERAHDDERCARNSAPSRAIEPTRERARHGAQQRKQSWSLALLRARDRALLAQATDGRAIPMTRYESAAPALSEQPASREPTFPGCASAVDASAAAHAYNTNSRSESRPSVPLRIGNARTVVAFVASPQQRCKAETCGRGASLPPLVLRRFTQDHPLSIPRPRRASSMHVADRLFQRAVEINANHCRALGKLRSRSRSWSRAVIAPPGRDAPRRLARCLGPPDESQPRVAAHSSNASCSRSRCS
jgi:hypothetical protein